MKAGGLAVYGGHRYGWEPTRKPTTYHALWRVELPAGTSFWGKNREDAKRREVWQSRASRLRRFNYRIQTFT